jgi:hypothetical protein
LSQPSSGAWRVVQTLVGFVVVAYMIGLTVSGTYFNWTYARDNGFVRWLFLGELVSTAKAFVWPYFFAVHGTSHRDRVTSTAPDSDSASEATLNHTPLGENARSALMAGLTMQEIFQKMPWSHDDTITARRQIDRLVNVLGDIEPAALDSVFPGWGQIMFDEWIPAMRNVSQLLNPDSTIRSGRDALRETSAQMMAHMQAYDEWMNSHRSQFLEALFGQRIIEAYTDSAGRVHTLK